MTRVRVSILAGLWLAGLCLAARVPAAWASDKLININTASATELSELKGIGDAKAQVIVAYREKNGPFKSVDELRQVHGIGDKLLEKLRPQVTVSGGAAAPAAAPAAAKH
jgi:competence protein ComEA